MNKDEIIELINQGVYKAFDRHIKFFCWMISAIIAFQFIYDFFNIGMDATDSPTERSNMVIRVDYQTKCEYLESGRGGLTPRLNADGKQLGCK